jgi:hypothetical protein
VNNSPPNSPATPRSQSVTLTFQGQHVPSFKNSKMLTRGKLITKPEYQKIMQAIIRSFESQLRSWFQMNGIVMEMGPLQLSSIASYLPLDDSRKWIVEHSVGWQVVSKGQEGVKITIEPL